jgi:hypothetical protein
MPVIIQLNRDGLMTLQLAGTLHMGCVADVDHAVASARKAHQSIVLDLARVRLIDRPTLQYVIDLMHHDVQSVINCPDHVRRWIERESVSGEFGSDVRFGNAGPQRFAPQDGVQQDGGGHDRGAADEDQMKSALE